MEFVEDIRQGYCEIHKGYSDKQYNKYRYESDSERTKFYKSTAWKKFRKRILKRDEYSCVECAKEGIITVATDVHHLKSTKTEEGWKRRLDEDGVVSVCRSCHNKIEKYSI